MLSHLGLVVALVRKDKPVRIHSLESRVACLARRRFQPGGGDILHFDMRYRERNAERQAQSAAERLPVVGVRTEPVIHMNG